MAHAEHVATIDRPIGEVFAFLADGLNNPRWRPDVTGVGHVSGVGVGARYSQTMRGPGGRTIQGDYLVTRYDEPGRLDFEVTAGPARPTGSFSLREVSPDSTEVTFTLDLQPSGMMRLMAPMINKQMHTEVANLDHVARAMSDAAPA